VSRRRAALACTAVALVLLAACSGGEDTSPPTSAPELTTTRAPRDNVDGVLRVGVLLPRTGDAAAYSPPLLAAIELAEQQIDGAGGVLGRPVQVLVRDEGSDPAEAAVALDTLLDEDEVDAVIGPASSQVALALLDRVVQAGVVTCSPLNTAVDLTDHPDDGLYFRTMPSDRLQALALGRAVARSGRRTTGILYPDDDYGRSFLDELRSELARFDNTVVSAEPYATTADDVELPVRKVLALEPETVAVIGLEQPGGRVLRELRRQGSFPAATPQFVSDGMRRDDLFDVVEPGRPDSVSGVQGTAPSPVPTAASAFVDAFHTASPGTSLAYASYAYDCMNLLALASQAAGSDDPALVKQQMEPTSRVGVTCRDFASCTPLLADDRNIDYEGASGKIEFDGNGDPTDAVYDVFEFADDGAVSVVRQISVTAP
jgi:branched-chain amino acid transport system substrate-binding protein